MQSGLQAELSKLVKRVKTVFGEIVKSFDHLFVVEEIDNPKRNLLRLQIQKFVSAANAQINGALAQELATATKDSS